jgi:hypothetical protein
VKKQAGLCCFHNINPIDYAPCAYIPALFGQARGDASVKAHHTQHLHEAYAGGEQLMFDGSSHPEKAPELRGKYICGTFVQGSEKAGGL